jgi:gluconolactonase
MAITSRRRFLQLTIGGGLGAAAFARAASGQMPSGVPPSTVTTPGRDWGPKAPPAIYPDPDIIVVDPAFTQYWNGLAGIHRVATGFQWAEGPAWSSQGHYLVFSDVQDDTQYRFNWDDQRISVFRKPSWNSNGNAFDFQGRQLTAQHYYRRVVRWEHDGSMTVIADQFEGKPLNSPNDLVAHPDGSIWFTDPPYGAALRQGGPDDAGGPANPAGKFNRALVPRTRSRQPGGSYQTRFIVGTRRENWRSSSLKSSSPIPMGFVSHPTTRRFMSSAVARGQAITGPAVLDRFTHST